MALANASLTTTTPASVVYTCSNPSGSALTAIVIYNSDTIDHTVNLYSCSAGAAAAIANQLQKIKIPAGESYSPPLGKLLLSNTDVIRANTVEANTTSAVVITFSIMNF